MDVLIQGLQWLFLIRIIKIDVTDTAPDSRSDSYLLLKFLMKLTKSA